MVVGEFGRDATAGSSLQKPTLQEVRLVDIFDRIDFFVEHRRNRVHADGSAVETFNDSAQQLSIHVIEALLVYIKKSQTVQRHLRRDLTGSFHLSIIADTFQKT